MAIQISKLPRSALSDVREFVRDNHLAGPDPDDAAVEGHIASMTAEDFLDAWLCWNGIQGWTQSILCVIDKAREAEYH